ncbi:MAG: HDOD domain-containing protein [bacterium]
MVDEAKKNDLKKLVDQIQDLPALPSVVPRLLTMVESSDTTAADLNAVITQDPALTAKVLKLVNSAFYGFSRRITTVTEAVVILGFNAIKSLALSASVFEVFKGAGTDDFDRHGIWEHSVGTGLAAETTARWIRYPNPETAMVAGILHNIGKIVLDIYFHQELEKILEYVRKKECTMLEAEEEIVGVSHPQIGGWLAQKWNLPSSISNAIIYYRSPLQAPDDDRLVYLVHVGDVLARTKNIGWTGDKQPPVFQQRVWDRLELQEDDIKVLLDQLEKNLKKAEAFMQLANKNLRDR